jgi:hypothetical protein
VEEDAMSDPQSRRFFDVPEPATGDPDRDSTWNTLDGTADLDELVDEEDLENFLVEPIPDPVTGEEGTDAADASG